jgi:hypothetical protein
MIQFYTTFGYSLNVDIAMSLLRLYNRGKIGVGMLRFLRVFLLTGLLVASLFAVAVRADSPTVVVLDRKSVV